MHRLANGRAFRNSPSARPPMRTFPLAVAVLLLSRWAPGADAPREVAAWASGPMEVRVAFDRAVDPATARGIVGRPIGFDSGRPGAERRATIRIAASRLEDQGRTLIMVTDPHPRESRYTLTLPGLKASGEAGPGTRLELAYDLGGVEVSWSAEGAAKPGWSGWWPAVDPVEARKLLAGSAEHDRLWPDLNKPGKLTLRTLVAFPAGVATVRLNAAMPFEASFGAETAKSTGFSTGAHQSHDATLKAESTGEAAEFSVVLATGTQPKVEPRLRVSSITAKDPAGRPIGRSALVLPWAPANPQPAAEAEVPATLLTGGDPVAGEAVFHGDQAKCATCHAVRGRGGAIGPDLSELAGRDRAWVYRNIAEPSASIHPEYVSFTVALKDGRIAMGVVRAEGADAIKVGDIDAKQTLIPRAEVEEIRPSASSIMPVGLLGAIGEDRTRDLIAFLTAPARKAGAAVVPKPN